MTTHSPVLSSMAGEMARLLRISVEAKLHRHRVADADELGGLVLVLAPMSSHRSLIFGTCLRSSSVSRWIGLRAITPNTGPLGGPDGHPLADQHLRVPAADRLHVEEAVVVDVLHDQADLVAVAGQHHPQRGVRVPHRDHVAVQVGA